jgi:thiamine biosynthesis protein ThiI
VKYGLIILRYGEIALKGKEVRKRFEDVLISNIKNAFNIENITNKIIKDWGRIYVFTDKIEESMNILKKIFGIVSISSAFQTESKMDLISKLAIDILKNKIDDNKSFAIRTTRTGDHDFSSQDVSIKIGADIVKMTGAKVDLTNPDFELFIEIRNEKAFLFTEKIVCVGGLPFGTQGNILAFIDDTSSILAAWYLIKRGCKTNFLILNKSNENILKSFLKNWFIKSEIFYTNPDEEIIDSIIRITYDKKLDAIVTNHNIFDISKDIFSDLKKLKKSINLPILSPLISMSREEIDKKCTEIGLLT